MVKSNPQRKTRSDKFPLTLHATGQYCKKIKGKLYYFGSDKGSALARYLEEAAYLHLGKKTRLKSTGDSVSLKMLCNLYLDHQNSRTRQVQKLISTAILLVKATKKTTLCQKPFDQYRQKGESINESSSNCSNKNTCRSC